jgi:hypothetical protein
MSHMAAMRMMQIASHGMRQPVAAAIWSETNQENRVCRREKNSVQECGPRGEEACLRAEAARDILAKAGGRAQVTGKLAKRIRQEQGGDKGENHG